MFFWRDIVRIVGALVPGRSSGAIPRNDPDARMGWLIIIGTIPIVVLGLLFQDQIETTFRSLWLIASMLIVFGILLGVADWVGAKRRKLDDLTVAARHLLRPRAGARAHPRRLTLGRHDHRWASSSATSAAAAARYAFLLAIPAVFGSGLYQLVQEPGRAGASSRLGETAVATRRRVRRGARRHRVPDELDLEAQLPAVRDLPPRCSAATLIVLLGLGVLQPY